MTPDERDRLRDLFQTQAIVHRNVTLTSGKQASYYIYGRLVTLSAEGAYLCARAILDLLDGTPVDAVGGPTSAADPIAGAVAAVSFQEGRPVRGFFVRKAAKDYGIGRQVEGPVEPGMRVAVVDDTVTTGGSLFLAIDALEQMGCTVAIVLGLVDRQEGGRERFEARGYRFKSVFTISELGLTPAT